MIVAQSHWLRLVVAAVAERVRVLQCVRVRRSVDRSARVVASGPPSATAQQSRFSIAAAKQAMRVLLGCCYASHCARLTPRRTYRSAAV